jgi:hypothetical protein
MARQRLELLARSGDGFEIAEMDLRLRGPGQVLGTRQSGLPDLALASLSDPASYSYTCGGSGSGGSGGGGGGGKTGGGEEKSDLLWSALRCHALKGSWDTVRDSGLKLVGKVGRVSSSSSSSSSSSPTYSASSSSGNGGGLIDTKLKPLYYWGHFHSALAPFDSSGNLSKIPKEADPVAARQASLTTLFARIVEIG